MSGMVNVDLGWPAGIAGNPDPNDLLRYGIQLVRYPSKPEVQPDRVAEYNAAGIYCIAVVTAASEGLLCPANCWQIGNEPNLPGTADTLSSLPTGDPNTSFVDRLQLFRNTYPESFLIPGALANWGTIQDRITYIENVYNNGGLAGYNCIAVHYPPTSTQVSALSGAVKLPVWITESHVAEAGQLNYQADMRKVSTVNIAFCWSESMATGFGLTDNQKLMLGSM